MKGLLAVLAAVAVFLTAGVWLYNAGGNKSDTVEQREPTSIDTKVDAPKLIIGNPDAKITIVEYGDFQCPLCKRFFEQTEPQLLETYINNNQAKIEFRVETHIGPDSVTAAEAAYCANDQGQFKAYHDELYQRQGSLRFSKDNLKQLASELGLASNSFNNCLESGKYQQTVLDSNEEAKSRIRGTPTFFVDDQKIEGAQPFSTFKAVIDAKLR